MAQTQTYDEILQAAPINNDEGYTCDRCSVWLDEDSVIIKGFRKYLCEDCDKEEEVC